ncbi:hypothetical protein D3C87_1539830 [compost metagenome]
MLDARRQHGSFGLRDLENSDLIAGDVLEHHVSRFRKLGRDAGRAPISQRLKVFPDQLVNIQAG